MSEFSSMIKDFARKGAKTLDAINDVENQLGCRVGNLLSSYDEKITDGIIQSSIFKDFYRWIQTGFLCHMS